jgi:DNA-binding NtrC family response regulator
MSQSPRLLLVDDDRLTRWALREKLHEQLGVQPDEADSVEAMLERIEQQRYDLILMDIGLPGLSGVEGLARLRQRNYPAKVIMATANNDEETAIACLSQGAFDYVCKPFDAAAIMAVVNRALERQVAPAATAVVEELPALEEWLSRCIGECPAIQAVKQQVRRICRSQATTVLIQGESGTGKDVLAKAIHYGSRRGEHPFMDINCTALPATLLESELFGYEKGAFTDAKARKPGLLELAGAGTVLLDEIGDLELFLQAKLLRVIEERRFKRVGGVEDVRLLAGIVATTNVDLQQAVAAGRFRKDLFYRLNVIPLQVPPLRQRQGDIPLLVNHFLRYLSHELNCAPRSISWGALSLLCRYPWPGNVRELRNQLERILVLEATETILVDHLPPEIRQIQSAAPLPEEGGSRDGALVLSGDNLSLEEMEKEMIRQALARASGNLTRAGELLGLHRDTLRYRAKKYGLLE